MEMEGTHEREFLNSSTSSRARANKSVRFDLRENSNRLQSSTGMVRVKITVTKQQLRQMLACKNKQAALEELLSTVKRRSMRKVQSSRGWRPALQSIPEEL
ncbi:hypothetical protein AMTRI_Chr09g34770 [Amborella trichopoda]